MTHPPRPKQPEPETIGSREPADRIIWFAKITPHGVLVNETLSIEQLTEAARAVVGRVAWMEMNPGLDGDFGGERALSREASSGLGAAREPVQPRHGGDTPWLGRPSTTAT